MTTDSYIRAQYLQLIGAGFLLFFPQFLSHITSKLAVSRCRPPVPYGANFYYYYYYYYYNYYATLWMYVSTLGRLLSTLLMHRDQVTLQRTFQKTSQDISL